MRAFRFCKVIALFAMLMGPLLAEAQTTNTASGIVYIIPIRGMIEPALLYVIRRGVADAVANKAQAIIFVMDTPGGTLNAAGDIVSTIQNIKVPTYTFVEKNAFSAGAIIAMATDEIYMAPGSVIGDAMPIMMTPFGGVQEMPEELQEKSVSAVAALIRSAAQDSGHDSRLAEKMVRRELEYKIGNEVISPAGQLLTLTNIEAEKKYGKDKTPLLSKGTVEDIPALLKLLGRENAETRTLVVTPAEKVARFIAALAPIFLIAGLLGIYIEIKTPGFGLPGILGGISLAIFFWGHHIAGLAGLEDILIFMLGVILLLVELLFIPGFGLTGILGISLMIWSLLNAMVIHYPGTPWYPTWPQLQFPLLKLSASIILTCVGAMILGRFLPKSDLFNRLVLGKASPHPVSYAASTPTDRLVGLQGKALSALRPAGTAAFGDRKLDVVTKGDFIDAGTEIRILETHGSRIIVESAAAAKSDKGV